MRRACPAQDFESPERCPQPRRVIVAAGHHGADERSGGFLARAFAGEHLLADIHGEVLGIMRIARRDVRMEMLDCLSRVFDLLGQIPKLPADAVLLVEVNRAQMVELADLGVDFDLFHHGGIAGRDGLDFGVSQSAAFEILGGADRSLAAHDLLDEAGLGFEGLPHIGVERASVTRSTSGSSMAPTANWQN